MKFYGCSWEDFAVESQIESCQYTMSVDNT